MLAEVAAGEEVAITRYGKVVARLTPAAGKRRAPSLAEFLASIPPLPMGVEELIRRERDDERY